MSAFLWRNWPVWLIVVLGVLAPWHWFADGRLIAGGDHLFYYNPTGVFYENLFTWINRINFGEPNYAVAFLFPFLSFFKVLSVFGFSPVASEVIWAISLFLLPGLFMFLLVRELLPEGKSWREGGAFVAALFYMFNPYIMTDILQISQRPVQMVLPLLFLLWHKGLSLPAERLKYSLLFALATLLTASTGTAPAFLMIIPLALLLYTLFYCVFYHPAWRHVFLFVGGTALFCFIFNLWWLVPASLAYLESGSTLEKTIAVGDFTKATPLWEALRLLGFWAFRIGWGPGIDHIPYAHDYYEDLFLILSYFFTVLGLFGLVIGPRRRLHLFFGLLFLLGVFLAKGANPPFGEYYTFLFKNFSPFALFREPFSKFTTLSLFSLAVLLGLSWGKVSLWLGDRLRYFMTLLLVAGMLTYSFPIVTGQALQDPSWHKITRDSLHVEIPSSWFEAGDWFRQNDPEGRIMLFPRSSYGVCYNWVMGTCVGQPVARMFVPNQTIRVAPAAESPRDLVINGLYDSIVSGRLVNLSSALGFFGIRYALLQKDMDWRYAPRQTFTPIEMSAILENPRSGLGKIRSFSPLDVYSVEESKIYPLIYATANLSPVSGSKERIGQLISFRNVRFPESFYFIDGESGDADGASVVDSFGGEGVTVVSTEIEVTPSRSAYRIKIPQDGTYRLYLSRRNGGPFAEFEPKEITVFFDTGYQTAVKMKEGVADKGDWLLAGEFYFKAGEYVLSLSSSAEDAKLQEDYFRRSFVAESDHKLSVTVPPGRYRLSFAYLPTAGSTVEVSLKESRCTGEKDCEELEVFKESLGASADPIPYTKEFIVYAPAKKISLNSHLNTSRFSSGSLFVEPPKMVKFLENQPVLVKVKEDKKAAPHPPLPTVDYRRRNPTLYEIKVSEVRDAYLLTFLESFNRNWEIKIGGKALPEERHIMINGFANGWFLKPEDVGGVENYPLTLEYRPQRYLVLSFIVSAVGISLAIMYLMYLGLKARRGCA